MDKHQLAQRLLMLGYTELFQRLDDRALTALWNEAGSPEALEKIALDGDEDARARFLAAEVVLAKRPDGFSDGERREIGSLYARALRGQFTGSANEWTLPEGPLGRAGEDLLNLGRHALPGLATLLDDDTPVIFEGSKEAMVAASYGYRVKDLAAEFIAHITGLSFPISTDLAARDAAIAELRRRLP
jgi:hypothetical protein